MCVKKEEKKFFEIEPKLLTHSFLFFEGFNRRCTFGYNSFSDGFPSITKKLVNNKLIKISDKLSVKKNDFMVVVFYQKD